MQFNFDVLEYANIARIRRVLACDGEDIRLDVMILGKALGAGVIPISAGLADKDVMLCIQPGEHRSTFGGNPLASAVGSASLHVIKDEKLAESYHPISMVFSQAKGACIWDPEGHKYLDFFSVYSAVNQGHYHPKIVKALAEQADRLTVRSRAFYNDKFPIFAELLTSLFGYEMMLPMNTGVEGVETALKLTRKWGYLKTKSPRMRLTLSIAVNVSMVIPWVRFP